MQWYLTWLDQLNALKTWDGFKNKIWLTHPLYISSVLLISIVSWSCSCFHHSWFLHIIYFLELSWKSIEFPTYTSSWSFSLYSSPMLFSSWESSLSSSSASRNYNITLIVILWWSFSEHVHPFYNIFIKTIWKHGNFDIWCTITLLEWYILYRSSRSSLIETRSN